MAPTKSNLVRRSVSLDRELDTIVRALVGNSNFSAFANEAIREKARPIQMDRLLDDLDAEFGPTDDNTKEKAEVLWQTASRPVRT